MSKSPSLRRIQADVRELAMDPSDRYHAAPLENDMFEWSVNILNFHEYCGEFRSHTLLLFLTGILPFGELMELTLKAESTMEEFW